MTNDADAMRAAFRPADVCRALLAALDAADGRRRSRKRDQTPDAIGLAVKRALLTRVVAEDPSPDAFEAWLLDYQSQCTALDQQGPALAMARAVFDEWRLAQASSEFRQWLQSGAPSDDARPSRETPPRLDAAAIVLAGGKSSRMGRPKALLPFDGQPLIAHVIAALRELFADVILVAAPGQELPDLPARLVRDEVAHQGPVRGIYEGLSASEHAVSFVTSCDSPFLQPRLIAYLVSESADCDVVVPHWEGRPQPLHAVYRRAVLPELSAQLERGELRPVSLYDRVRTRRVPEHIVARFDPDGASFFNMNTPEEYEQALARWRAANATA